MKEGGRLYNLSLLLIVQKHCLLLAEKKGTKKAPILVKDIVFSIVKSENYEGNINNLYQRIYRCLKHLTNSGILERTEIVSEKKKLMIQFFLNK